MLATRVSHLMRAARPRTRLAPTARLGVCFFDGPYAPHEAIHSWWPASAQDHEPWSSMEAGSRARAPTKASVVNLHIPALRHNACRTRRRRRDISAFLSMREMPSELDRNYLHDLDLEELLSDLRGAQSGFANRNELRYVGCGKRWTRFRATPQRGPATQR